MPDYENLFSDQEFDKDAWAEKKQTEREAVYARIESYTDAMRGDGKLFRTYLDVQARFDRYSVGNAVLIAAQRPTAIRLADFDTWKREGVYIRRGAEAISILEPGKEYTREDGSIGVSYNVKKVFDISQTNAPRKVQPAAVRDGRLLLKALMYHAPCKFAASPALPPQRDAAYDPERNMLLVRPGLDAPVIFRALARELSQLRLQDPEAARCAAYLLCRRHGVPMDAPPAPPAWRDLERPEFRRELTSVRDAAGELAANMERFFTARQRQDREAR